MHICKMVNSSLKEFVLECPKQLQEDFYTLDSLAIIMKYSYHSVSEIFYVSPENLYIQSF